MCNFHLLGAVPIESQAYIVRPFEKEILNNILGTNWVLLLGPRQHGKTSSLIRVRNELITAGFDCAIVDLQAMPPCESYEELIEWFANRVAQAFGRILTYRPSGHQLRQLGTW